MIMNTQTESNHCDRGTFNERAELLYKIQFDGSVVIEYMHKDRTMAY